MVLNIKSNGQILQDKSGITLADFTILTGENGSGKTQLLKWLRDFYNTFYEDENGDIIDMIGNNLGVSHPLLNNNEQPLRKIIYSEPGLRYEGFSGDSNSQEQNIMFNIKNEWEQLEFAVIALRSLKGKSFLNDESELAEINAYVYNLINRGHPNSGSSNIKKVMQHEVDRIKKIALLCDTHPGNLTYIDLLIFYQVPTDIFSSSLGLLFHQYYLKNKYYFKKTEHIKPPWEVFNEILGSTNFKYRVHYKESTNDEIVLPIYLIDTTNNKQIFFENLSSGETTIMALIFALYNSSNGGTFPEVILFDEPDAHLHPSLTATFLKVVQDVFVGRNSVKIIMTTHSPSTVALAPDDSIYIMDRNLGYPYKLDRNTAVNILSEGFASVNIDDGKLGIAYNLSNSDLPFLLTEGITDKIILETAWLKLNPTKRKIPFYIQDCFDAKFLGNLIRRGGDDQDGIYSNYPDKLIIALFDFDAEGYNNWNGGKDKFPILIESNPKKCLTKGNREQSAYIMLLPIPENEVLSKQCFKSNGDSLNEKTVLPIELLFYGYNKLEKYFLNEEEAGGQVIRFISHKQKRHFARLLKELDTKYFEGFIPLFEKIEELTRRFYNRK